MRHYPETKLLQRQPALVAQKKFQYYLFILLTAYCMSVASFAAWLVGGWLTPPAFLLLAPMMVGECAFLYSARHRLWKVSNHWRESERTQPANRIRVIVVRCMFYVPEPRKADIIMHAYRGDGRQRMGKNNTSKFKHASERAPCYHCNNFFFSSMFFLLSIDDGFASSSGTGKVIIPLFPFSVLIPLSKRPPRGI